MTKPDHSPWQRPVPSQAPSPAADARPVPQRKPFASNAKAVNDARSPWARPEQGSSAAESTKAERAAAQGTAANGVTAGARKAEAHRGPPTPTPGTGDSKRAFALDRRSILLLAILPSFAAGMLNQFYLEPAYRWSKALFYLVDAAQFVALPLVVWFFVLRPANIRPKDFGLRLPVLGSSPVESSLRFALVTVLLWASYWAIGAFAYQIFWREAGLFGYGSTVPTSFPLNFLAVAYFALTAAVVEEVVFRGLAWNYFSQAVPAAWRAAAYVLITSLLFAGTHCEQGPHGMIAAFAFGIAAAVLYLRLKDLWPLIFGHFMIDVAAFWPK